MARTGTIAAACGLGGAALALVTPLVGGLLDPSYDHCAQYISELGESGAPDAPLVNFGGFLPIGLFALGFALLSAFAIARTRRQRAGFLFLSSVGWAYLGSVLFPCDPGCPLTGSATQQVHSTLGVVEYLGGAIGLLLLGRAGEGRFTSPAIRRLLLAGAAIVAVAFVAMILPSLGAVRGLVQRVADGALFLGIVACSLRMLRAARVGSGVVAPEGRSR